MLGIFLISSCHFHGSSIEVESYPWQVRENEKRLEPLPGYWPQQAAPRAYRSLVLDSSTNDEDEEELNSLTRGPHAVLANSLSGIAARAVNEGRHDELIWVQTNRRIYREWLAETVSRNQLEERPPVSVHDLVKMYRDLDLLHGYVLYRRDDSQGRNYTKRDGINISINAATTLAAGMDGVLIVEERIEEEIAYLGLRRVADARMMTEEEAFEKVKASLSNKSLLTMDPRAPNLRDMAIAHRLATVYGTDDFFQRLVTWVEPNSVVLGWNSGDEGQHTQPLSRQGLVQSASNWANNIPMISAGAHQHVATRITHPQNDEIQESDEPPHLISFLMSDGDNVQYLMGGFFDRPGYWGEEIRGDFPVGWSICAAKLAQVAPGVLNKIEATATPNDNLIEFSGGYFYPDYFGRGRPDGIELLKTHADMLAVRMEETGTRVLTFICKDVTSRESLEAYQVFADRIPGLLGMIAVQYYPYNGGHGEIFWVEGMDGHQIPVITPRYCIWEHANWKGGGTPARIARLANEYSANALAESVPSYSLVSVHIWSVFQEIEGNDEQAENVPRPEGRRRGSGERGLYSIKRTIDRLDPKIRVVTPEEMILHLRAEKARNTNQQDSES